MIMLQIPPALVKARHFQALILIHYNTTPVSEFSRDDICSYTTGNAKAQLACIVMTQKAGMLAFQFPKEKIS